MVIITDRIYKGLHNGMDRVAYNLLVAKFQGAASAQTIINKYAIDDLKSVAPKMDFIIGIAPRDSGSKIVEKLTKAIATQYRKPSMMMDKGQTLTKAKAGKLKGCKVLIIDDVIYTGKTMRIATKTLLNSGVSLVKNYALAKSKTYK